MKFRSITNVFISTFSFKSSRQISKKQITHCYLLISVFDIYRSSRPEVFLQKGVLKIWSKFTGEHPCRTAISIKLQSNFIEITFRYGCSPVYLLHIFRTSFPKNTCGWLLLCLKPTTDCLRTLSLKTLCLFLKNTFTMISIYLEKIMGLKHRLVWVL